MLSAGNSYTDYAKDDSVQLAHNFVNWVLLIVIPFLLVTNIGKVRNRLPLFRSRNYLLQSSGWVLVGILIFIGFGIADSSFNGLYSAEYWASKDAYREEQERVRAERGFLAAAQKQKEQEEKEKQEQALAAKKSRNKLLHNRMMNRMFMNYRNRQMIRKVFRSLRNKT